MSLIWLPMWKCSRRRSGAGCSPAAAPLGQQLGNRRPIGLVADGLPQRPCCGWRAWPAPIWALLQALLASIIRSTSSGCSITPPVAVQDVATGSLSRCTADPCSVADQQRLGSSSSERAISVPLCFPSSPKFQRCRSSPTPPPHGVVGCTSPGRRPGTGRGSCLRDGAFKGGVEPLKQSSRMSSKRISSSSARLQLFSSDTRSTRPGCRAIPLGLNARCGRAIDGEIRIAPAVEAVQRSTVLIDQCSLSDTCVVEWMAGLGTFPVCPRPGQRPWGGQH